MSRETRLVASIICFHRQLVFHLVLLVFLFELILQFWSLPSGKQRKKAIGF
uniref:Uncharacterized protein n=1 Tax=Triticum urartu TaxID=4572 RepID=A0A8R7NZ62_TRIUA